MRDIAFIGAVIFGMEIIDHVFGRAVGLAVAITAFVGCILFLWHAGEPRSLPDPPQVSKLK